MQCSSLGPTTVTLSLPKNLQTGSLSHMLFKHSEEDMEVKVKRYILKENEIR